MLQARVEAKESCTIDSRKDLESEGRVTGTGGGNGTANYR
ncbi:hypothetical protein A2U01_0098949, partial [Trifolium medium]|nr:hypothetical protein [Trifolium medium]